MAFTRLQRMFRASGNQDYIGEPTSILQHSLQAAARATDAVNGDIRNDPELVLAALFHDVGHVAGLEAGLPIEMNGCGITDHEHIGADLLLQLGFTNRISKLVRSHVTGKRYLCWKDPKYYNRLTDASKTTLTFQGGPMTEEEGKAFEQDPDFEKILLLRNIDELAKDPAAVPPSFESYKDLIDEHSQAASIPRNGLEYLITSSQRKFWKDNSYLVVKGLLPTALERESIESKVYADDAAVWVEEVSQWPKESNKWLLHFEQVTIDDDEGKDPSSPRTKKQMCRAENFVNFHEKLGALCRGLLQDVSSQLFEEEAVLFKEKINYKLAGGSGFAAHQDTPAYIGLAKNHISALVAIDPCTEANGCLEIAPGRWDADSNIPLLPSGIIDPDSEATMAFKKIICYCGDVLFFNGYAPHRSNKNNSSLNRRVLILTYNPLSEGDHHQSYYEAKHAGINGFTTGTAISFQKDFMGVIVD